jgi:hypothetical protein
MTFFVARLIELPNRLMFAASRVECPDCVATRSLGPHRGVPRFTLHDKLTKRKTKAQLIAKRWAKREMTWKVVGGERGADCLMV